MFCVRKGIDLFIGRSVFDVDDSYMLNTTAW